MDYRLLCPKEFFRQEYWDGLPFPTPGDLPDPGTEPTSLASPALPGGSLLRWHLGSLGGGGAVTHQSVALPSCLALPCPPSGLAPWLPEWEAISYHLEQTELYIKRVDPSLC